MPGTSFRFAFVALLSFSISVALGSVAEGDPQAESPVVCSEPAPITLEDGDHTTGCEIALGTDTDEFRFVAVAGEMWRILVSRESNLFLDPHVQVLDPMDAELSDQLSINGNLQVDVTIAKTGTHRIFLFDEGLDEVGTYTLHLFRIPPSFGPPLVDYGVAETDNIDFRSDVDFFQFQAIGGTTVRLLISRIGNLFLDPDVELWSPSRQLVLDQHSINGNFLADVTLPNETGIYTVLVTDNGFDELGDYHFEVQCFSATCVPPLPVCNLDLSFDSGTLDIGFDLETPSATTWTVRLVLDGLVLDLGLVPLPGGFEFSDVASVPDFPSIGVIGFLSTFSSTPGGLGCSDWETIDTGPPTFAPSAETLRDLFRRR